MNINEICKNCPYKDNCSVIIYCDERYHWNRLVDECPAVEKFIQQLIHIKIGGKIIEGEI